MKNRQHLYTATTAMASVVLYYVLELSRSGRTAIDWIVIALVVGALGWNLFKLGQRLSADGTKGLGSLLCTLSFWTIGLLNTLLLRPEDVGEWRHWAGRAFILLAIIGSIALAMRERRLMSLPDSNEAPVPTDSTD